jgi:hypothetical protein
LVLRSSPISVSSTRTRSKLSVMVRIAVCTLVGSPLVSSGGRPLLTGTAAPLRRCAAGAAGLATGWPWSLTITSLLGSMLEPCMCRV